MQLFPFAAAIFAAAVSLVVLSANVQAQSPPPPAITAPASSPQLKPRTWLVDNKNRLVTVQEKDGPPLFAQVITTDDLHIELRANAATKKINLILKDARGKSLYTMPFPYMEHGMFQFGADFGQSDQKGKTGGTSFTLTPATEDQSAPGEKTEPDKKKEDGFLLFVLNSDNWPVRGDLTTGSSRTVINRVGTKMSMTTYENGKKTSENIVSVDENAKQVTLTQDGKEVAAANFSDNAVVRVHDEKGEVTSRFVKQEGKDYTEYSFGERKILVEGTNWHFDLKDGVLMLKPTPPTTADANK